MSGSGVPAGWYFFYRLVIDTITLPSNIASIQAVNGEVWALGDADGRLTIVEPASRSIVDTIQLGTSPDDAALGFGRVWITDQGDDSLTIIDPDSHQIEATVPLGVGPNGRSPWEIGCGSGIAMTRRSSSLIRHR